MRFYYLTVILVNLFPKFLGRGALESLEFLWIFIWRARKFSLANRLFRSIDIPLASQRRFGLLWQFGISRKINKRLRLFDEIPGRPKPFLLLFLFDILFEISLKHLHIVQIRRAFWINIGLISFFFQKLLLLNIQIAYTFNNRAYGLHWLFALIHINFGVVDFVSAIFVFNLFHHLL